jgi:hypothetical protein
MVRRVGPVVALFAVVLGLVALTWPRAADGGPVGIPILPERCTVGVAGNAVTITLEGPGAEAECDATAGTTSAGLTWYRYAEGATPGAAIVCELSAGGIRYTVRDQGLLNLLGSAACEVIARRQAEQGP